MVCPKEHQYGLPSNLTQDFPTLHAVDSRVGVDDDGGRTDGGGAERPSGPKCHGGTREEARTGRKERTVRDGDRLDAFPETPVKLGRGCVSFQRNVSQHARLTGEGWGGGRMMGGVSSIRARKR